MYQSLASALARFHSLAHLLPHHQRVTLREHLVLHDPPVRQTHTLLTMQSIILFKLRETPRGSQGSQSSERLVSRHVAGILLLCTMTLYACVPASQSLQAKNATEIHICSA